MRFKNYFNNLEKYWSANFLALISVAFLFSFITWALINLVIFAFHSTSFSEYCKLAAEKYSLYSPIYPIIFFPVSCILSAGVSIFYIFIIISKKKWFSIANILPIIIIWIKFFAEMQGTINSSGCLVSFIFFPMTILGSLISIGIYLILLLLELIPKFRVPLSPVSQNNIFKKYIRVFYCFYFVIMCSIIYVIGLIIKYCA